jgi:hypothetical protein
VGPIGRQSSQPPAPAAQGWGCPPGGQGRGGQHRARKKMMLYAMNGSCHAALLVGRAGWGPAMSEVAQADGHLLLSSPTCLIAMLSTSCAAQPGPRAADTRAHSPTTAPRCKGSGVATPLNTSPTRARRVSGSGAARMTACEGSGKKQRAQQVCNLRDTRPGPGMASGTKAKQPRQHVFLHL